MSLQERPSHIRLLHSNEMDTGKDIQPALVINCFFICLFVICMVVLVSLPIRCTRRSLEHPRNDLAKTYTRARLSVSCPRTYCVHMNITGGYHAMFDSLSPHCIRFVTFSISEPSSCSCRNLKLPDFLRPSRPRSIILEDSSIHDGMISLEHPPPRQLRQNP